MDDERKRPPYLGDLPRDRRGNWTMYVLAAALLAAMFGGWQIYISTVAGWHARFKDPAPAAAPPAPRAHEVDREAERAAVAREFQRLHAERMKRERAGWKCIAGTPFRPLPGGGWENVPGERC